MSADSSRRVDLTIEKVVFGGEGLAFHEGLAIFVPDVLPGERVSVEISESKKNFARAKLLQVLEKSPERVEAPCMYVPRCGGCQYQHVSYKEEKRIKESQIKETFSQIPGFSEALLKPLVFSEEYRYRNHVTLHVQAKAPRPGFFTRDNVTLIPIKDCLLADTKLLPVFINSDRIPKKAERLTFRLDKTGRVFADDAEAYLRIRVGELEMLTSTQGFFQANLSVTGKLLEAVKKWTTSITTDVFLDLYAGSGLFSFYLSHAEATLVAIEEHPASVRALRMNREEKKWTNMEIVEGSVEKVLTKSFEKIRGKKTLAVLDPPRAGLDRNVAEFLARESLEALVYVSCDLPSLVRDLKILTRSYSITEVIPFDMFPKTKHLETVVFLKCLK